MATLQMYMDQSRIENTFEDEVYGEVWGRDTWIDNAVGKIEKIIVHRPGEELLAMKDAVYEEEAGSLILKDHRGRIRSYWKGDTFPDISLMQEQHDAMTDVLRGEGIEVINQDDPKHEWPNMTFARDFAEMTPKGAVLSRYSMYFHQGETPIGQKTMADLGVPIIGSIQGKGTMEGGSFCQLDSHTAVVGRSVRINDEGIEQMRSLLKNQGIELIVIDMPAFYIHLDEAFVPVDTDKVLVSTFILPFWFLDLLKKWDTKSSRRTGTIPSSRTIVSVSSRARFSFPPGGRIRSEISRKPAWKSFRWIYPRSTSWAVAFTVRRFRLSGRESEKVKPGKRKLNITNIILHS